MDYQSLKKNTPDEFMSTSFIGEIIKHGEMIKLHNNPFPCWSKLLINNFKNSLKNFKVHYQPPNSLLLLSTKTEVREYAKSLNLDKSLSDWFDFNEVFCVCHEPEHGKYFGCAYGKSGCNLWIHKKCVGLQHMKDEDLEKLSFICPLCSEYLKIYNILPSYIKSYNM
jgi:hypothetical protein